MVLLRPELMAVAQAVVSQVVHQELHGLQSTNCERWYDIGNCKDTNNHCRPMAYITV